MSILRAARSKFLMPVGAAAIMALASPLAGAAHAAGPTCTYNALVSSSAPGLTATVCIERSGQYARGSVWVQNSGKTAVYVKADAHTDDGGSNGVTEGWVSPGTTLYDVGNWVADFDAAAERGHAMIDYYTGSWGWTVIDSPLG
ncbi:hypothetical protein [Streptomyces sp. NPDC058701]|uniref:hypothetical protein n=1 Tax=Streptomyces sp. NPDC058701 TaxID=3346608 RepID=UPI003654B8A4